MTSAMSRFRLGRGVVQAMRRNTAEHSVHNFAARPEPDGRSRHFVQNFAQPLDGRADLTCLRPNGRVFHWNVVVLTLCLS